MLAAAVAMRLAWSQADAPHAGFVLGATSETLGLRYDTATESESRHRGRRDGTKESPPAASRREDTSKIIEPLLIHGNPSLTMTVSLIDARDAGDRFRDAGSLAKTPFQADTFQATIQPRTKM